MNIEQYLPIQVLHDFVGRLDKLNIEYMLTGSMAMIRYTVFRQTADFDVVVDVKASDADRIIRAFDGDYYVPENAVRRSVKSGGMFNLIEQATAFKIDCIVKKQSEYEDSAFGRREQTDYYGGEIWISSKEDLIVSKLVWAKETGSEMQLRDIVNLMRSGFDDSYIERWVGKLGIEKHYSQCTEELAE